MVNFDSLANWHTNSNRKSTLKKCYVTKIAKFECYVTKIAKFECYVTKIAKFECYVTKIAKFEYYAYLLSSSNRLNK